MAAMPVTAPPAIAAVEDDGWCINADCGRRIISRCRIIGRIRIGRSDYATAK